MRRIVIPTLPLVLLATATASWATTFYLHESASPVPVPGGTTTFVLDETPPLAATPVAEQVVVPKKTSQSFPTFIAPAFPAPVPLGLDFEVVAHLSANQSTTNCVGVSARVDRVDELGNHTLLARAGVSASLSAGSAGGTVGFAPVTIPFNLASCDGPFEDVVIGAGQSIAITVTVANNCKSNRTMSLAYDATGAPGASTFGPLPEPDPVLLARCFSKCQLAVSKASAKFVDTKSKCILKCETGAQKGRNPFSDCEPPYAGDAASCIADPSKGAEAKAIASILKACAFPRPCPPCYAGGECTVYAPGLVAGLETVLDALAPAVLCEETSDKARTKCMAANGKAMAKFVTTKSKCFDRCAHDVGKGTVPAAACVPPASDPDTVDCIGKAEQKALDAINKACFLAAGAPPCYDDALHPPAGLPSPSTAAGWVGLFEPFVDGTMTSVYCGSPSGAFVD